MISREDAIPVITNGNPAEGVEIPVIQVSSLSELPAILLRGWRLVTDGVEDGKP